MDNTTLDYALMAGEAYFYKSEMNLSESLCHKARRYWLAA